MDHIGDIWEISAGHTAMRLGFVALNGVLKSERVKKLTGGKEVQIPDDACFWASLITTMTVVSTHSLGLWAGPANSHVGQPVPEMILGQLVGAIVLASTHYAAKYHEPIGDLVVRMGKKGVEGLLTVDKKLQEFKNHLSSGDVSSIMLTNKTSSDDVS